MKTSFRGVEQEVGVLDVLGDVGVLVEPVHLRLRDERQRIDVVDVRLPVLREGRRVVHTAGAEAVRVVQDLRVVEHPQRRHQRDAVRAVRHLEG
eukprot:1183973-Prorocentrum_minimum.AAC.1